MNLGKVIRETRLFSGISQRAYAKALGTTPSWLCKIEAGKVQPNDAIINTFLKKTGMSVAQLFISSLEPGDYKTHQDESEGKSGDDME